MEQIFIDRFIMPQNAKAEFTQRMQINREFIKKLPGFIGDEAYERTDDEGNLICITIAVWASEEALKNAKELVQAEYQQQGFNLPAMLQRLDIRMERGQYNRFSN
ncbi:antibiotic biosynthesis monooxygenase [Mucilaginibacter sp. OK283]|jgi:heme-degrading monooxygenase HmoA|uniref:antibiotic biosynthesis monooxygenase family protein n=1 Tax=Mucilaginibacter sp. OK283 TaxID=1881049 RepID=UPI0008BAEF3E|nr:antibiotic biosynthesis monooxygenase [Mucilaginibacter sp. OK283]SEO68320.1 Antibiotic biosynthesis monooxygenase [Mucilaginibacter sp. OK283]